MPLRHLAALVALIVLLAAPAVAQQNAADAATAKFRLADSFLRAGQSERAMALLEDLHAAEPASFAVFNKLKEAYVLTKRYDDAVALIEDRMERTAPTANLLAEMGRLYVFKDDLDAAAATWQRAIDTAPDNPITYRTVYASQISARLYEDARDLLLAARERLGDEAMFQVELAELYARTDEPEKTMDEYAALLSVDPQRLSFVQSRLGRLLEQAGAAESFRASVERLIRDEPLVMPYRQLAAWLYAETGDFPAALNATRAIDRLRGEQGQSLFSFANAALNAEAFDEALQAYEIILDRHADGPIAPLALLNTALLYELRGERNGERAFKAGNRVPAPDYDRSLDRYTTFLRDHPTHPNYPVALRRLAGLQKDVFLDFGQAEALLREIITRFPQGDVAAQAQLDLGEVELMRDNLVAARTAFSRVEESERIGEQAELARLELARLDFYEGQFDMAKTRAQAMNRNTATDVANDAIALKLLVSENTGPDSTNVPLRTFARARLLQRQQRPGLALAAIDSLIAAYPQHALGDEAHYLRAQTLRDLARYDDALAELHAFADRFPDSYLIDRNLFTVGEVYERDLGDAQAAISAYADLLARYPGSLLVPEARSRIRQLRGDGA